MATNIGKIAEDGFSLVERDEKLKNLAMISLKIALQAYFSTYKSMLYSLHLFDAMQKQLDQKTIDCSHSYKYCQYSSEAIVHFQHFAELVCKDFLRAEHQLLAIDASKKSAILHKLLKKETVSEQELEGLKTLEFGESLSRLCALIKERQLGAGRLNFISDAESFLEKLNKLRNREWHRGAFILRYPALDRLVGENVLPFVRKVTALKEYARLERFWKYKKLSCGIDPIEEIVAACKCGKLDIGKVALLKELGRAAYDNPLDTNAIAKYFNQQHQRRAKQLAESERSHAGASDIKICPVCGIESLVVYDDVEMDDHDPETGGCSRAWRYTWQVICTCCTFEINKHLKNPSKYGLAMEDYWHGEEL